MIRKHHRLPEVLVRLVLVAIALTISHAAVEVWRAEAVHANATHSATVGESEFQHPSTPLSPSMATGRFSMATPQAAVWGACGLFSRPGKVVRVFRGSWRTFTLRCGPWFTTKPRWGYRHIKYRHLADFQRRAAGTFQNWRDIADLSMAKNAADPDVTVFQRNGNTCRSSKVYLYNLRTGALAKVRIFHMVTKSNGDIKTAYPARRHCLYK